MAEIDQPYRIWDERHALANFAQFPVTRRNGKDVSATSEGLYEKLRFSALDHRKDEEGISPSDVRRMIEETDSPYQVKEIANRHKDKTRLG